MNKDRNRKPLILLVAFFALIFVVDAAINIILARIGYDYSEFTLNAIDAAASFVLLVPAIYLLGFRPLIKEIDETSRLERELRISEERFKAIATSAKDAIMMMDPDGIITYMNLAGESMFGYTNKEVMGLDLHKVLAPQVYYKSFKEAHEKFRSTGRGAIVGRIREVRGLRKDGTEFPMELSVAAAQFKGKWHAIGIVRDITERKEAERAKDEFVNMVTHELRTPTFVIKEAVDQMLEGLHGDLPPAQKNVLAMASSNVRRLSNIVDDLLDISKIEAGRFGLAIAEASVVDAAEEALKNLTGLVQSAGLDVRRKYSGPKILAEIDRNKVVQVFTNLIGNAIKFTENGFIEVGVADKNDSVECYVADSGPGIAKEAMHKLFGKFEQLGTKTSRGQKGTGLGLAICKGIVELHGGRIWVESKPSAGSKFFFSLPKKK